MQLLKEILGYSPTDLEIKWHNLNFQFINSKKENYHILKNVSGSAKNKNITAIMGSSGSGKTTLLEGIAKRSYNISGDVTINKNLINSEIMEEISGFLSQNFFTVESLTSFEYMEFVGILKMHKLLKYTDLKNRIQNLLNDLGLKKCINVQISKLSGGEKKRLFLASILISDPAIIFCDEPTTGLDGYNALTIIKILNDLSMLGKIVIISLHQPSSDIIYYLRHIILLSNGSAILQGSSLEITDFFNRMNLTCPISCNIAEFFIKQISIVPGDEDSCLKNINNFKNEFIKIQKGNNDETSTVWRKPNFKKRLKCSFYKQFSLLFWREMIAFKREFLTFFLALLTIMIIGLIIAIFYSSLEHNLDLKNIQDTKGFLFLTGDELIFTAIYAAVNTFPKEIDLFFIEKNLYSSVIYYIIKIVSMLPQMITFPYMFIITYFWILPTMNFYLYLKIGFVISAASFTAISYGFMLSAVVVSIDYINLLIVPLDLLFMLIAGFLVNLDTLPPEIKWLKYLSPFFYSFEMVSILQFDNMIGNLSTNATEIEKYKAEFLYNSGLSYENYYFDFYASIIVGCILHFIGCISMIYRRKMFDTLNIKK